MSPERVEQSAADTGRVPVYFHSRRVLANALAVCMAGMLSMAGAAILYGEDFALSAVMLALGSPLLLFALSRLFSVWKWRAFFVDGIAPKAYVGFDRTGLHLLDVLQLPWSAVEYLKISRLAWPRRTYLLVGLKSSGSGASSSGLARLTADNMLIALAAREATGAILEPQSFLALCIEAKWSPFSPVALTHDARRIAELAERFFRMQETITDRTGAQQLFDTAQAAYQAGNSELAEAICTRVLGLNGEHDEAMFMQSLIALAAGRAREAETHLRRAFSLREHPAYAGNLGLLLQEAGRTDEAETWFRRALEMAPQDFNIMCNLANLLKDDGRTTEAELLYLRVIELDPQGTPALNNLGILCWKAGRLADALGYCRRALALDPQLADAHCNLGIVQKELGQWAEAEASYRRALELRPDSAYFHNNLGLLFQESRRQHEAQDAFERAIELRPDYSLAHYNLSLTRLAFGDYAHGLPGYEARYDPASSDAPVKLPQLPFPQWLDQDLEGKSLLIWCEQGFGDYIQFARYFPLLKSRGLARLTLCCAAALAPLLQTAEGVDAVISEQAELDRHDYWTFPMSLALRFGTTIDSIPAQLPFLHALPERVARWAGALQTQKPKVGLVWKGASGHKNDAYRSLPSLAVLAPLWKACDAQFVSLQKGQGESEAESAAAAGQLVHLGGCAIADLGDTAAIVAQLDLVICVDTAVAHVAGSLGKRCWVLLPAVGCDWRWHLERGDSPWYPGVMRLFRQGPGDWNDAVNEVAAALKAEFQG